MVRPPIRHATHSRPNRLRWALPVVSLIIVITLMAVVYVTAKRYPQPPAQPSTTFESVSA
jgi:hypothetical protein